MTPKRLTVAAAAALSVAVTIAGSFALAGQASAVTTPTATVTASTDCFQADLANMPNGHASISFGAGPSAAQQKRPGTYGELISGRLTGLTPREGYYYVSKAVDPSGDTGGGNPYLGEAGMDGTLSFSAIPVLGLQNPSANPPTAAFHAGTPDSFTISTSPGPTAPGISGQTDPLTTNPHCGTLRADSRQFAVDSRSKAFTLLQQSDGNLVVYGGQTPWWHTHTYRNPGAYTVLQSDGNLVIYSQATGKPLWASHTEGHPGARLDMQDDGNLVIYAVGGKAIWQSHIHPA